MKWIKLFEEFSGVSGDLSPMKPQEVQDLFVKECNKKNPDFSFIEFLLDDKLVDINVGSKRGITALHSASHRNNAELVELLLSYGARLEIRDDGEWTALHWASAEDSLEVAEYLIEMGADIEAESEDGTPLHCASNGNALEVAKLLIDSGADVNAKDRIGGSPLDYVKSADMFELLTLNGAEEGEIEE